MAAVADMETGRVNLGSALEGKQAPRARRGGPTYLQGGPASEGVPTPLRAAPQAVGTPQSAITVAGHPCKAQRSISCSVPPASRRRRARLLSALPVHVATVEPPFPLPPSSPSRADGGPARLMEALRSQPIALVGRTTCAYSLEAASLLNRTAGPVGGADAVFSFW